MLCDDNKKLFYDADLAEDYFNESSITYININGCKFYISLLTNYEEMNLHFNPPLVLNDYKNILKNYNDTWISQQRFLKSEVIKNKKLSETAKHKTFLINCLLYTGKYIVILKPTNSKPNGIIQFNEGDSENLVDDIDVLQNKITTFRTQITDEDIKDKFILISGSFNCKKDKISYNSRKTIKYSQQPNIYKNLDKCEILYLPITYFETRYILNNQFKIHCDKKMMDYNEFIKLDSENITIKADSYYTPTIFALLYYLNFLDEDYNSYKNLLFNISTEFKQQFDIVKNSEHYDVSFKNIESIKLEDSFIKDVKFLGIEDIKPEIKTERIKRNTTDYFFQGGNYKNIILYTIIILVIIVIIIVVSNLFVNQNLHKYVLQGHH